MYNKSGCIACHATGDVGGWFGQRMDGIGARRDRAYIAAHITDAQAHFMELSGTAEQMSSKMPRFMFSKEEVEKITDYLMTIPKAP